MSLKKLFEDSNNSKGDRQENPTVKFDREKEKYRFAFVQDLSDDEFPEPARRHYVKGVGYIQCNQKPGFKAVYDKDGQKTGERVLTLWSDAWVTDDDGNKRKVPHCLLCNEKKVAKATAKAKAIAEGRTDLSQDEARVIGSINSLSTSLILATVGEVREKKKVIKELGCGFIVAKAHDVFYPQFTAAYTQIKTAFDNKDTLLDNWFVMDGKGNISIDDPLKDSEKEKIQEMAESMPSSDYYVPMSYVEGMKKVHALRGTAAAATPIEDNDEDEVQDANAEGDEEIPF